MENKTEPTLDTSPASSYGDSWEPFDILVLNFYNRGKSFTCSVLPTDTVSHLARRIQLHTSIPADLQVLVYAGKPLCTSKTLGDYGIEEGSDLLLQTRLNGQ